MTDSDLDAIIQKLRELLASEYARGEKDAIGRILNAAQGAPLTDGKATSPQPQRQRQRKDRAPAGAPQALIDRVLADAGSKGASPSEIAAEAVTENEKAVSFSGIRFALARGRKQGRYRNKHGKWFLKNRELAGLSVSP